MNLNYLTDSLRPLLCPTDCRLRPDQRAIEDGDYNLGRGEKHRLEEKQRAVRKYNHDNGIEWTPLYFDLV